MHAATDGHSSKFIVVLDPGHGGKDYGAIGLTSNEKSINLAVAQLVAESLKKDDSINVVMTRNDDTFLSLQERANVANRAHGDLFISIHVNSVDRNARNRTTVAGASVYTLGLHRTAENLEVAKRENAVMVLEPDYSTTYSGFNPNSTESYIVFELNQNIHLDRSVQFAQLVQEELVNTAERKDKGVRQAGFWVLMATSMPAVLIELDFICNPESEKYISSRNGQRHLADAIVNAITSYRIGHKTIHTSTKKPISNQDSGASKVAKQSPENQSEMTLGSQKRDGSVDTKTPTDKITYRVQILASDKPLKSGTSEFKGVTDIEQYKEKGLYKYTVGNFDSMNDATKKMKELRKKFPQAFIIKWDGTGRVY
jgi:N-acetylmuramoyl-L-alanine amidase